MLVFDVAPRALRFYRDKAIALSLILVKSGIEGLHRGSRNLLIGQMKKLSVFRVTLPYLNLLVKPKKISFSEKIYNFMHFNSQNAFQNA